jgi:hypothetical protein
MQPISLLGFKAANHLRRLRTIAQGASADRST